MFNYSRSISSSRVIQQQTWIRPYLFIGYDCTACIILTFYQHVHPQHSTSVWIIKFGDSIHLARMD